MSDEDIVIPESLRRERRGEHPTTVIVAAPQNGNGTVKKTVIAMLAIAGGAIAIPLIVYLWFQLSSQVEAHTAAIVGAERKLDRVEVMLDYQKESLREQKAIIEKQDSKMDRVLDAVNAMRREGR